MQPPNPKRRPRGRPRALLVLFAVVFGFILSAVLIEVGGQIYASFHPSYWGLFFKPDPVLGWRLYPGLRWNSTGTFWYQRDFNVPIQINSQGFRDLERTSEKPPGVVRIALLGDSLVEAIQVRFEETAAQVLETKLNEHAQGQDGKRYEVLNFGISNFGIGQFLLTWENEAQRYDPDYVVMLVSALHMNRTVIPFHSRLRVRPIFRIQDGELERIPPRDYEKFVKRQERTIQTRLNGHRIGKMNRRSFIGSHLVALRGGRGAPMGKAKNPTIFKVKPKVYEVNLELLKEFERETRNAGSQLGIVDSFTYFNSITEEESVKLRDFCREQGIGHIPLSPLLLEAVETGNSPRFKYDAHYNDVGNALFAQVVYDWIVAREEAP